MNDTSTKTKAQALYEFYNSILPAYEENAVYGEEKPDFPYLTYELRFDGFTDADIATTFSIWYRSSSLKEITEKIDSISAVIGREGYKLPFKDGYILIRKASPFAQLMGDDTDDLIKRGYFNLYLRYYSNY